VAEFLLELYMSRSDRGAVVDGSDRAAVAAQRLRREGASVRYMRSIFVPEDETCFLIYEAASIDDVRRAASLAGLPADHIVEALETEA
jgi:hypothetical protein